MLVMGTSLETCLNGHQSATVNVKEAPSRVLSLSRSRQEVVQEGVFLGSFFFGLRYLSDATSVIRVIPDLMKSLLLSTGELPIEIYLCTIFPKCVKRVFFIRLNR